MKNRHLQLVLILFSFALVAILLLIFYFGNNIKSIFALCSTGLLIGLLFVLIKGYVIPSKWLYNHRFGLDGFLFIFLITYLTSFENPKIFRFDILIITLLIGIIIGYFGIGYIQKKGFKSFSKRIAFDINPDLQILNDIAICNENNNKFSGKLILTKDKLFFILIDSNAPIHEIDLHGQKNTVKIKSRFGIPYGFVMNDHLQFSVSFPRLWIKKIIAV